MTTAAPTADGRLAWRLIVQEARARWLKPSAIRGRSQAPAASHARQAVMLRLHEAGWSYPRIGRALHRHHTTALIGVRAAKARKEARA